MPAGFEKIAINSRYGNYKIGIDKDASYSIEGHARYGNINYPDNEEVDATKDKNELKVKGFVGSDRSSGSAVSINTSYGLTLIYKIRFSGNKKGITQVLLIVPEGFILTVFMYNKSCAFNNCVSCSYIPFH